MATPNTFIDTLIDPLRKLIDGDALDGKSGYGKDLKDAAAALKEGAGEPSKLATYQQTFYKYTTTLQTESQVMKALRDLTTSVAHNI